MAEKKEFLEGRKPVTFVDLFALMKEDELLRTADGVRFAVCNQWGAYNIPNIFRVMEKWGWNIIKG